MDRHICIRGECTLGGMKRNQIALTFDDGPSSHTYPILDVLRQYDIPATFFVHIGRWSFGAKQKKIIDRIYLDGHKIGNHGNEHGSINGPTPSDILVEALVDTHRVVNLYRDRDDLLLYRNPGGYWSGQRAHLLNNHALLRQYIGPIFWNVGGANRFKDGQMVEAADWLCQKKKITPETCSQGYFNKILSNYHQNRGSIVLMHDIKKITPQMLPLLFKKLRETGIPWEFIFVQDIPAVRSKIRHL